MSAFLGLTANFEFRGSSHPQEEDEAALLVEAQLLEMPLPAGVTGLWRGPIDIEVLLGRTDGPTTRWIFDLVLLYEAPSPELVKEFEEVLERQFLGLALHSEVYVFVDAPLEGAFLPVR